MTELYKKLLDYSKDDYYPFHMPGHKRNPKSVQNLLPVDIDITEIDGFDNLHHAENLLLESQKKVSELFKTKETLYSINGSTAAILSAVSASVKKGGKILLARNCHKSVYHAIYLRELNPVYVYPEIDLKNGINYSISPNAVKKCFIENPDIQAVIITSPTYDGIVSDVKSISKIVHSYHVPLIVDEAHGSHLMFHSFFPESAINSGADLVIHSFHKTLPSMTQTAVLHICSGMVDRDLLHRFMEIYQTSSPSYVLMASIDECVNTLINKGKSLFENFVCELAETRSQLSKFHNIKIFEKTEADTDKIFDYDLSKIIITTENSYLNGHQLYHILLDRYHLQMEMEAEKYVLALTSVGDTKEGFQRLIHAIKEINEEDIINKNKRHKDAFFTEFDKTDYNKNSFDAMKKCIIPSFAMDSEKESVLLDDSIGKVAAEFTYLYPPGIPLIVPGEEISASFISILKKYKKEGFTINGLKDHKAENIRIIKENKE